MCTSLHLFGHIYGPYYALFWAVFHCFSWWSCIFESRSLLFHGFSFIRLLYEYVGLVWYGYGHYYGLFWVVLHSAHGYLFFWSMFTQTHTSNLNVYIYTHAQTHVRIYVHTYVHTYQIWAVVHCAYADQDFVWLKIRRTISNMCVYTYVCVCKYIYMYIHITYRPRMENRTVAEHTCSKM